MSESEHIYDITVIGGGPVGMFTAFYAGMRQLDTLVVESLPELGGQVSTLYPEKMIRDVAGFAGIKGAQLIDALHNQMTVFPDFAPTVATNEEVTAITKDGDTFTLTTTKGERKSRSIVVAIGGGSFAPRKLAIDYDQALENQRIFYFVKNVADFAGKTVAIAGGGDSAIDWALTLEGIAKKVYLIHRRDQFRGLESSVERLHQGSVELMTPYLIDGITNDAELTLDLKRVKSEEHANLAVDALLVNYGFTADNHALRNWKLPLDHRLLKVDENMETSIPGIYGLGDCITYPGKVKLIAAGFGEAPTAINDIAVNLYPERRQPLHSTQLEH
ncbi:NAD(P)/FAD-dependent oxidoreductase [Loigolactobacillus zhaoyuanensis]|uniref:NAD(P)/FAD-dependent oxidoreductase n=1 Tax=Loigolactobacillus zhaoyuanensis TaxID=2486017 RepID=UPI000F73C809|nr:NAD(P)/FAD-dependent oxidoreductase [Loigolactobacillus zhaoyuanensis]